MCFEEYHLYIVSSRHSPQWKNYQIKPTLRMAAWSQKEVEGLNSIPNSDCILFLNTDYC